jgi:hypothetical protein
MNEDTVFFCCPGLFTLPAILRLKNCGCWAREMSSMHKQSTHTGAGDVWHPEFKGTAQPTQGRGGKEARPIAGLVSKLKLPGT